MACHAPSFPFTKGNKEVKSHLFSAQFQSLPDPHWAQRSKQSLGYKATSIYCQSKGVMQIDSRLRWNRPTLSKPYIAWSLQTHTLLIYYNKKGLASLFSKMHDGSTVTRYSVYCLPPIFPGMWRLLETVSSVNANGVVTYFQVIVEIEHSLQTVEWQKQEGTGIFSKKNKKIHWTRVPLLET